MTRLISAFCFLLSAFALCGQAFTLSDPTVASWGGAPAAAGGAASWTPTNLGSALLVWLANTSLGGANGDRTNVWVDSSGNNNFATNTTVASQAVITNSSYFGGKAALKFYGTNWYKLPNATWVLTNRASCSLVFAAEYYDSDGSKGLCQIDKNSEGSARAAVFLDGNEYGLCYGRALDADGLATSDTAPGRIRGAGHVLQADFLFSSGAVNLYTNSILVLSDTSFGTTNNTSTTASYQVVLGANYPSGSEFIGQVAEVAVIVPAMSGADRTNFYLWCKTNLSLTGP